MATTYMNRSRGRSVSQLTNPVDDELVSIERHFEFVNLTFKYSINDLENIIQMLRARLSAEEAYLNALLKVKKLNFSYETDRLHNESALTFQKAVRSYENNINDIVESRHILKEKLKLEIDVLVKQKETEDQNRKTFKTKLYDANTNYSTFRNRDIVKLQKAYVHKCDELKLSQNNWQQLTLQVQQQQQQQQQQIALNESTESPRSNRNSTEISSLESRDGESIQSMDQHWKGVAGLISQMRSKASGSTYIPPLDQNKQNTKVAKLKKDIIDADADYRSGILTLENLRKRQAQVADETNRQIQKTIKRKTETVKTSLMNILHSEIDSLQQEMRVCHLSYDLASSIDSKKDLQVFASHYQSQGYIAPTPFRYENYYFEGKCREVLFGSSLEDYALDHNRTIPLVVIRCCEAVENMGGLQKEGIYRLSGRQLNVEQLKHNFELDEMKASLDGFDVVTIATVMKTYLRELKRPLFDFNVQSRASYNKSIPQIQRFQLLEAKLATLSLAHRSTLYYVIRHLAKVNANSQINKMNIPNLAMIFTPVIFHDFNQSDDSTYSDWSPDDLFEDLILHFEVLFPRAEEMARKHNEQKLNQAMSGTSPYSQYSQSNLLYLVNKNTPAQNTTPPPANNATNPNVSQDQQYPPKLTTIIGNVTPRVGSLQQLPTNRPSPPMISTDTTQVTPISVPPQQGLPTSPAGTINTPLSATFAQQVPVRQTSLNNTNNQETNNSEEQKK